LADEVKKAFPHMEVEFIPSGGGVFEVSADGQLIFSKKKEHRFPEHEEIFQKLKTM